MAQHCLQSGGDTDPILQGPASCPVSFCCVPLALLSIWLKPLWVFLNTWSQNSLLVSPGLRILPSLVCQQGTFWLVSESPWDTCGAKQMAQSQQLMGCVPSVLSHAS